MPYLMCSNLKDAVASLCSAVIIVKKVSFRRVLYIFRAPGVAIYFLSSVASNFFVSSFKMASVLSRTETQAFIAGMSFFFFYSTSNFVTSKIIFVAWTL